MAKIRPSDAHRGAIDALLPRVEAAFTGPVFWEPFVRDAHAADIPRLSDCLEGTGRVVDDQFRRRGLRSLRPADMPLSTSPMDGLIGPIRDALHPRRYGLKNRERTNRLLMLMQLHANRQDDPLTYASDIRAWLQANGSRPRVSRRASSTPPASPRCADLTQNAPSDATGGTPKHCRRSVLSRARCGVHPRRAGPARGVALYKLAPRA